MQENMLEHHKKFHFVNGKIAGNLRELVAALQSIDDRTFHYHANDEKNDFSNWLSHVLEEKELAEQIRHSSRTMTIKKIKNHINQKAISHNNQGKIKKPSKTKATESIKKTPKKAKGKAKSEKNANPVKMPKKNKTLTKQLKQKTMQRKKSLGKSIRGRARKKRAPQVAMHPRPFTQEEKQDHVHHALIEIEEREQRIAELEHGLQRMIATSKAMKSEDFIYGLIFGVVMVFLGYLIYSVI